MPQLQQDAIPVSDHVVVRVFQAVYHRHGYYESAERTRHYTQ